jgi:hypothetical protein
METPMTTTFHELPPALEGWRWGATNTQQEQCLIGPDGWSTKAYQQSSKAIAEALRRVNSQPKSTFLTIDAASARLREAGHTVEKQGMLWRVRQGDAEPTVLHAHELIARAEALPAPAKPAEPAWGPQSLPIRLIRRDGGTQARTGLNEDVVQEYAEAMRDQRWDWATIKRPLVYSDGASGDYWLADGFHRIEAAQRAGLTDYRVEVLKGDKRAAQLHAARANADHGLRRSRQDVQRAIELLLRDEEWAKWSDREIARHVHCTHPTVGAVRRQLESAGNIFHLSERQGADGKSYSTAGIAAANTARAALPPVVSERRAADDRLGERLEQMATERQAARAAIPPDIEAAAQNLALAIEVEDGGLLLYWPDEDTSQMDPLTPDLAREWLQSEAQGAALYRAEALGWEQQTASDKSRVWYHRATDGRETAAFADAALAAGDALRIAYGEMALTSTPAGPETPESRDADGPWWWASKSVAHPTAHHWHVSPAVASDYVSACGIASGTLPTTNPNGGRCGVCGTHALRRVTIPARIAVAIRDLAAHGWVVDARAGDQYRLVCGVDAYETGADGVIASALLLETRTFASADDLMAAVNAIEDTPPAPLAPITLTTKTGPSTIHPIRLAGALALHPAPSSTYANHAWSVTHVSSGYLVAGFAEQTSAESALDQLAALAWVLSDDGHATPALSAQIQAILSGYDDEIHHFPKPAACDCGQPSIAQRNIGGISAWRCQACAIREEGADLRDQLGDQYLGYEKAHALSGEFHKIAWTGGGGGYYSYDDALSMLHSSAMQLRRQASPARQDSLDRGRLGTLSYGLGAAKTRDEGLTIWRSIGRMLISEVPRRPRRPARDDVSAKLEYLRDLERYADQLDRLIGFGGETAAPPPQADPSEYGPPPTLAEVEGDPLAPIARRVAAVETLIEAGAVTSVQTTELRACHRALEDLVSDERVSTEAYDELSARIGEAQARVAEMLSE